MIMPIGYYMTILPFHHLPVMLLHQLAAVLLMSIGNPTGDGGYLVTDPDVTPSRRTSWR